MEDSLTDPTTDELIEQWSQIGQQVFRDIPALNAIWNPLFEASFGFSPWSDHSVLVVHQYVKSLQDVGGQALYALERLRFYSTKKAGGPFEFYVSHYLYDFIGRIKTSTDLLALIIKRLYQLDMEDKACSLEGGLLVGKLRAKYPNDSHVEKLTRTIDGARTSWLGTFDKLRDIVVHRSGLQFYAVGTSKHRIHIYIPLPKYVPKDVPFHYDPEQPLAALKLVAQEDVLIRFLVETKSGSISEWLITADPMMLCEELWSLLIKTADDILQQCTPSILNLVSTHGKASSGLPTDE